ncbi:unnamed protein product [Moneuplotes crassus]|uniref:Uncharacterized protein n=1 Tax=Euplotes crassus TaxID=5936 RepID=A0AAD1XES1_EUPCR|nr:unnamed protein product [Moneuplotes crassus]
MIINYCRRRFTPSAQFFSVNLRRLSTSTLEANQRGQASPEQSQIDQENFKKHISAFTSSNELPDSDMELNNIMRALGDPKFSFAEFTGQMNPNKNLSEEEKQKREEEAKVLEEKYSKSEDSIKEISKKFEGLNSHTLRMFEHTPSKIISEMAVRLFVGSRDIPKNVPKAMKLLQIAKEKDSSSMTFQEQKDIEFFEIMLTRMNSEKISDPIHFWAVNQKLRRLAEEGHPNSMYVFGSELLLLCTNNVIQDRALVKTYLKDAFEYLTKAAKEGVHSAYYYLGLMHQDGVYVTKDIKSAFYCFIEGAAANNALCYYNLSQMYLYGMVDPIVPSLSENNSKYLHFKYLKRSAEEGFVNAQHFLAIAYFEGIFTPKDDKLSLAWFREAARNGNPMSFINAGDLLTYGSNIMEDLAPTYNAETLKMVTQMYTIQKSNLKPNLLFALSQYISAYRFGAIFLEERMKIIVSHLRKSGEFIRE